MPELPSIPKTTKEKMQRALDLYDGKVKNQATSFGGFFSKIISPDPIQIKLIRGLKQDLDNNPENEALIIKKIGNLLRNDETYPNSDTKAHSTELMLDYLLFDGNFYMAKCDWMSVHGKEKGLEDAEHKKGEYLRRLMLTNRIHYGNLQMVKDFYLAPKNKALLNEALLMATANASVESVAFILEHCGTAVDLNVRSNVNGINNNALMLAIAKGRQHVDSQKGSRSRMGEVIDVYLKHPSAASEINHQDRFGMTALHLAVLNRDLESAKKLIALGADPRKEDKFGKDASHYFEFDYAECNDRLAAYTIAQDFHSYLKDKTEKATISMETIHDYFNSIHTMPKKDEWRANEEEWDRLMAPFFPEEGPPTP